MASQTFSIAPKSEWAAFGNRGEELTDVAEEGEDGDWDEDRLNSCQVDEDDGDEDTNNESHVNI